MQDQNDDSYPWPEAGRSLFDPAPDPRLVAAVSLSHGQLPFYAHSYRRAAEVLFERIASCGSSMNTLVLPMTFLWRHAIELQLKQIIEEGRVSVGDDTPTARGHSLLALWEAVREVLPSLEMSALQEIPTVDALIREMDSLDPNSEAFRYHDGRGQLGSVDDLDVRAVHLTLGGVSNWLDCVLEQMALERE